MGGGGYFSMKTCGIQSSSEYPRHITFDKMLFFHPKVLIFFLFFHKNICCGYSLEVPQ